MKPDAEKMREKHRGVTRAAVAAISAFLLLLAPAKALAAWGGGLNGPYFSLFFQRPALVAGPPVVSGSAFPDTAGSMAEREFLQLAALGIFKGDARGDASPSSMVNRQELAVIAVRVLGYDQLAGWYNLKGAELPFSDTEDIPLSMRGHIRMAVNLGLIKGLPGPKGGVIFAGDQKITLRDAVTVLLRAIKNNGSGNSEWPEEAENAVREAIRARVEKAPEDSITREEMAILVTNALHVGRYNADLGQFESRNSIIRSVFSLSEGTLAGVDLNQRRAYLQPANADQPDRLWLASQVFIHGADEIEELVGRKVTAIGNRDGTVVYIELR